MYLLLVMLLVTVQECLESLQPLPAGDNIQLDSSNGSVTITGLASTDVIVSERVLVQGITTSTGGLRIGTGEVQLVLLRQVS